MNTVPGSVFETLQMVQISLSVTRLERLARDNHASLMGLFVSYEEDEVLSIRSRTSNLRPHCFYNIFRAIGFLLSLSRLTKSPAALQMNLTHFKSIHN